MNPPEARPGGRPTPELGARLIRRSGWPAGLALITAAAGGVGFTWSYLAGADTQLLGLFLTLGLGGSGFALAYWGRNLIGERPASEPYPIPADDPEAREALAAEVEQDVHVITRRRFLSLLLAGGAGVFGLSQLVLVGSLGPLPRRRLFETAWTPGARLVTIDGRRITRDALAAGGFLVAFPEGHTDAFDSQVILLRPAVGSFTAQAGRQSWSPEGFVAYSRLCTHAGCPVAQYEDEANALLCPCHQSTFDLARGARPVSGPADRPLPQLPLRIDADGFLTAQRDFEEPVGPGFWNLP